MSKQHKSGPARRDVIKGTVGLAFVAANRSAFAATPVRTVASGRSTSFDVGWRFLRGDGEGLHTPGLDDSRWREVDLPHDWSIEDLPARHEGAASTIIGPFDRDSPTGGSTAFAVGGDGWYRKHFSLDAPSSGRVELLFDAVYMNSEVWLNGHRLGEHGEGYTPFAFDLTPHLARTGDNVLAVHVRNRGKNSRWYSGSGIHRHVWLDVFPEQARISRWGIAVSTLRLTGGRADIEIKTNLEDVTPGLQLLSRIRDQDGQIVWEGSAGAAAAVAQKLSIRGPRLWSPDSPALYELETELRRGDATLDRQITSFGVRIITFDAKRGMVINGTPIKLRGGCIHADNGHLGAASFDAAEDRKVRLLRARGYNALRPSHNHYPPAFFAACDRHGMMVVGETFDAWEVGKNPDDYSRYFKSDWRADLATIVKSARNHPSIVMWSIGNEIPGRNTPEGVKWQWELANEVHSLDPTRPVTAAINEFAGRQVAPSRETARVGSNAHPDRTSSVFLDIVGYNYKLKTYEGEHRLDLDRVFLGTESYPKDIYEIWDLTDKTPWLIGDFVWTAMDYLGEVGIGGSNYVPIQPAASPAGPPRGSPWPMIGAYCGDLDLIGHSKPSAYARDVVWSVSPLEIAVQRPVPEGMKEVIGNWGWSDELQSWTWPGSEGKSLAVRIYTSGDRVELLLNGKSVGSKTVTAADLKHVELPVTYAPGTLQAVAYRNGKEIGRRMLTTVGKPERLRLVPEATRGGAGRGDISYVLVEVLDGQGRVVPDAELPVQLSISGPAELAAFGNGSSKAARFQSPTSSTWHGRALAIIRGGGKLGEVTIQASSPNLQTSATTLTLA